MHREMRLQSPGGIPLHLHPLRGNIFPHCNPQTRPRERSGIRARVVSGWRLCIPCFPGRPPIPPAPHHKRRRRVLAGYTKLFKWDLLDGTLPNALPASSRSTASYKIQNPEELILYSGAIRSSTFDGMSIQTTRSQHARDFKTVEIGRARCFNIKIHICLIIWHVCLRYLRFY